MNTSVELGACFCVEKLRCVPQGKRLTCWWTSCRPDWPGTLEALVRPSAARLQSVVGADVSLEHFRQVSGIIDINEAIARLNVRLAARGALPLTERCACAL